MTAPDRDQIPDPAPSGEPDESSPVIRARFDKARELAGGGRKLYPNTFRPQHNIADLRARFGELAHDDFETLTDV
ncbi:MAG: hypothetical protein LBV21_00145, partial [Candidatus Adiutrix sp.]|nr:hypothetical protein [Candidatus Adiutrix sp.]